MILSATTMNNPAIPPPEPVLIILARKLILLGLLMVVAALGLQWLLRQIQIGSLLLPHILSDALMGLMAGFSVRWFLRKQTSFLRVSSAMVFLIGGLELLGWFTGWQIGLGPLRIGLSHVDWYLSLIHISETIVAGNRYSAPGVVRMDTTLPGYGHPLSRIPFHPELIAATAET
jgi:hypothetical protein